VTHSLDNVAGHGGEEDATTFVDLMQSEMAPPPVELQAAEDIERVQHVLAELPVIYREVLVMIYFHQFAYKEMSEMLGIPLGTIKSRLHAALAVFAKAYKAREASAVRTKT
jgi:RNA polymerase sigma-70 factor (ECF subfamily)